MGGLAEGRLVPVYATHDGGVTWAAATLVATSGQALFASGDGGLTWRRTEASLPAPQPREGVAFHAFRFAAPAFIDDRAGWARS